MEQVYIWKEKKEKEEKIVAYKKGHEEYMEPDVSQSLINAPGLSYQGMPYPMMKGDKADLFEKIRPEQVINEMRNRLMGKDFVDGKWVLIPGLKNISISEAGAWEIADLLFTVSNQSVSLSNLTEKKVERIALETAREGIYRIVSSWKMYGISSSSQIRLIGRMILNTARITLMQAMDEGIRVLLKGTMQEQRSIIDSKERGGLKDIFKRR